MAKKVQLKKAQVKKAAVKSVTKAAPLKKIASAKKTAPAKETPKAVKGGTKANVATPKKEMKKKEVVSKVKKAAPAKRVTHAKAIVNPVSVKAVNAKGKSGISVKEVKKKEVVLKVKKAVPAKKVIHAKAIAKPVPVKAAKAEVKGGVSVKEVKKKEVVQVGKKEPQKATAVLDKEIRAVLLARRQNLLKEILENRARESDSLKREIGDIYDEASTERDRELSLLLGDRDRQKLKEIDEALQRIEGGEYGICESCGEKIAPGRLKAQPFTKLCINCKAEEERQEARRKKFEAEGVYRNLTYGEEEEG